MVAAALSAAALVEAGATENSASADVAGTLLITAPLAISRSRPGLAVALAYGGLVLQGGLGRDSMIGVIAIVSLLLLCYSAGVNGGRRAGPAAAAVILGGSWIAVLLGPEQSVDDFAFTGLLGLAPWLAGRAARSWQRRADELRALNEQIRLEQEERARMAAYTERARIARDMHDVLAHSVSLMVVQLGAAEHRLERDNGPALEAVVAARATGKLALAELRRLLGLMREDTTAVPGHSAPAGLETLVEQTRGAGIQAELEFEGDPATLDAGLEMTVYRIVQEALTNSVKHGAGAPVKAVVTYGREAVEISVTDEGRGSDAAWADGGFGLLGMRERARLYGGTVEAGRRPGGGFEVRAVLPVKVAPT